jgi:hypothetical protein
VHVDFPCQQCGGVIPEFKEQRAAQWSPEAFIAPTSAGPKPPAPANGPRDVPKVIGSTA